MRLLTFIVLYGAYAVGLTIALARAGFRAQSSIPKSNSNANSRNTDPRHLARLLIIGATGGTGRELVAQALARGHAVTALVRTPSKLRLEHPRLTVLQGDVLDPIAVHEAVKGQEAVLSALGHRQFLHPTRILSRGTINLVRAMETHGVKRLVCETALGLGDSAGRMGLYYTLFVTPLILPFYFWDKTRQEQAIAGSSLAWTIVRPGALTSGRPRASYRHGYRLGSFLWTVRISRADVADFMLNQLADRAYVRDAAGVCW